MFQKAECIPDYVSLTLWARRAPMLRDSQSEFCPGGGNKKAFPVNSSTHYY